MTCRLPTKSGNSEPFRTTFHRMEQQVLAVQLDAPVLRMCLVSPPAGNISRCCQSVPGSEKP